MNNYIAKIGSAERRRNWATENSKRREVPRAKMTEHMRGRGTKKQSAGIAVRRTGCGGAPASVVYRSGRAQETRAKQPR